MRTILALAFAPLLFASAADAEEARQTRYVELLNRAHDSVTSLAIASAGDDAFRDKPLGAPLRGGGESATIEVAGDTCLYDFRFGFRNGRTLIYQGVDVCRGKTLRIAPLPVLAKNRRSESFETAAETRP
jgi:hypothetical protein